MTITADVRSHPAPAPDGPAELEQPRWVRPAIFALLAATAVLYLWGLGSSGWANDYYAAAVQAGTQDWKAWLFGSLDAGNAITVDKPPAALWAMALSGRLFGFSAFTMLLPQALMGVAAVGTLYVTVRRCSGPAAGLIAGAALALTPVAALMFRFNNPDALLVLLLVVAAYCMVRAIETASTRWIALVGVVIGFAFLTKLLQAFLVVPGLALAFLVAAPVGLWARLGKLAVGALAMIASAGWYLALVDLWPADSRPYIGGSSDNSLLQLTLGYNGIDRVLGGGEGRPSGGPPPGPGDSVGGAHHLMFGGDPGIGRLFGHSMGTQASWLLPAALIGLLAGLWFTRRTVRTAGVRASLLLWGGWLIVSAAVFSFMDGIIHPYYTVALAPAIAALVGISVQELWRGKEFLVPRILLATMLAGTGVWAFILMNRTPEWWPAVRWIALVGSIVVASVLLVGVHRLGRWTAAVLIAAAMVFGLLGPAAFSIQTITSPHSRGPMAMAGPSPSTDMAPPRGADGPGGPGGPGDGPGRGAVDNPTLENLIKGADNRWAAATVGSMMAGSLELKTGASVMSIGGFTGSDNSPTLEQFRDYVANHDVRYFVSGSRDGAPPWRESGAANDITTWVKQNFAPTDVAGTTVYDLDAPISK